MKRTDINRYSERRIQAMKDEYPERLALCERAQGSPFLYSLIIRRNGISHKIMRVKCLNGFCEICGNLSPELEPHEPKRRSHGARVSLKDSLMVCRGCHNGEHQGPQWSKG